MNQKKCPQCKNLISLAAPTCLYCGRPNKFVTNTYVKGKWDKEYNNKKNNINIFKLLISRQILFIFIILITLLIIINK